MLKEGKGKVPETADRACPNTTQPPKPKSRNKARCRFGPTRFRPVSPRKTPQPRRWDASSNFLPEERPHDPPESCTPAREARVTLAALVHVRKTPFDHYKSPTSSATTLNPYRFIQWRMGILEATFEAKVDQEIDDLLQEIAESKRPREETPPRPDVTPPSRPITKEECLGMFRGTNRPTSGSLLDMYRWAANLGEASCNFDTKWDAQSITLLDTYN